MKHSTVSEQCSCGATFDYSGPAPGIAAGEWRLRHQHVPPAPKFDKVLIARIAHIADERIDQHEQARQARSGA